MSTMTNRVAEGKGEARSNGRAGWRRARAHGSGPPWQRAGARDARGFTNVRVRAHEEPRRGGRVSALVKGRPPLEAAIRAEAREAPAEGWNASVLARAKRAPRVRASVGNAGAGPGLAM